MTTDLSSALSSGPLRMRAGIRATELLTFAVCRLSSPRLEARMDEKDLFVKYCEKEAPATRNVLARIPEGSSYRPDPKSRTAREIAWLIVREEIVLIEGLEKGQLEWEEIPAPATMKEVLATYDRHRERLPERFRAIEHTRWEKPVPFMFGGQAVMNE